MNSMMLLEMAASALSGRRALTCGETDYTIEELLAAAGAAGAFVRESGAEHLALLDVTSPAVPIGLFAAGCAGVPFVPLNYRLTGDELAALIARIAPSLLVTSADRVQELSALPDTHVISREDFLTRADRAAPPPAHPPMDWPMDPDAIAVLLFTSGTTGVPKAAVLRHKHLVSYVLGSVEFGSAAEDDAGLVSVPPYHIAGIASVLTSVYAGRRIVQLPSFDAHEWLRLAREERISHALVVPTMLSRIVDALAGEPAPELPSLRALSYGGGKMPLPVIERAMKLFPAVGFTNAYGLTETSSTLTLLGPEDHRAAAESDDADVKRRLTSVGRALPGVELEIRDEDGKPVDPKVRGEIHVRGEQVSGEYLGREPSLDADGWFPTRDGGYLDDEGYLFLEGRVDDVIVRGGENLSPGEIEDVLLEHAAVREAGVVGIPDEEWGEAVAAVVVLGQGASAGVEDLQEWVKRHLRSSRVPQRILFRDALPYNETGKLLRRELRAWLDEDAS